MRFLLDANMPRSSMAAVIELGHHAEFAKDIGLGNATDNEIIAHAAASQSALVTRDMDFSNRLMYPPDRYHGIVVLRLPDDMVAIDIVAVFSKFVRSLPDVGELKGRLVVVEKDKFRVRPVLTPGR